MGCRSEQKLAAKPPIFASVKKIRITWSENLLNPWLEDDGVRDLVVVVLSACAAPLPPGNSQGHDTALAAAKVIQSYNSTKGRR